MNIFEKFLFYIKKIFKKSEEIKLIESSKGELKESKKEKFYNSIKFKVISKNKKIETLTCRGNGLGIQKRFIY